MSSVSAERGASRASDPRLHSPRPLSMELRASRPPPLSATGKEAVHCGGRPRKVPSRPPIHASRKNGVVAPCSVSRVSFESDHGAFLAVSTRSGYGTIAKHFFASLLLLLLLGDPRTCILMFFCSRHHGLNLLIVVTAQFLLNQ